MYRGNAAGSGKCSLLLIVDLSCPIESSSTSPSTACRCALLLWDRHEGILATDTSNPGPTDVMSLVFFFFLDHAVAASVILAKSTSSRT